jgi:hypothetical protein
MVVDSVYHQLLKEDLDRVAHVRYKDTHPVKFLDKNEQSNPFRDFRLQYEMICCGVGIGR